MYRVMTVPCVTTMAVSALSAAIIRLMAAVNLWSACCAVSSPSTCSSAGLRKKCSIACSNSSCVGKYGHVASVVLFKSIRDFHKDIQRIGEYLSGLYHLWLFCCTRLTQGVKRREVPRLTALALSVPAPAESPGGCGLVRLYLRLRVAHENQVIHCLSTLGSRASCISLMIPVALCARCFWRSAEHATEVLAFKVAIERRCSTWWRRSPGSGRSRPRRLLR